VILFVGDAREGVAPLDREVAGRLRASGKPVVVAANKVDTRTDEPAAAEFSELGFSQVFAVSAIHGRGIGPLLDAALARLPQPEAPATPPGTSPGGDGLKLAIVGRPNVGKSSIVNALTRSERVIVSPIPGTTRDSIDVPFEVETEGVRQRYVLIDTAGLRKERRIDNSIEFFSVKRAEDSIDRCDLVVFVLDAESGILEQDKKIADKIVERQKACVVVVNKWDAVESDVAAVRGEELARRARREHRRGVPKALSTLGEFGEWVQEQLFFLDYAPVIFTSATSGFHLDRLLEAIRYVAAQLQQTVPTALLNRTLQEAVERQQPVSAAGHFLKFFYATQLQQAPPTFLLFVNRNELFSESYRKYLAGQLRRAFGFEGCPILLRCRARPKKVESIRRSGPREPIRHARARSRKRRP
jgi:GTP-binding protein